MQQLSKNDFRFFCMYSVDIASMQLDYLWQIEPLDGETTTFTIYIFCYLMRMRLLEYVCKILEHLKKLGQFWASYAHYGLILSFIILAVLRRGVIAPAGYTASYEEISQRWRAVDNTVSDLIGPRFEPQTSSSRDERVTAQSTGLSY